ncbi:hypothetical protein [Deinococcus sp.]|uniref:hypothetical protein n=1 Tax=Deinococcus sp. TaxID=47478 RepID=UPI003B5ABC7A
MQTITTPTAPNLDLILNAAAPILSIKPVVLPAPARGTDLQVRVSAPATGESLHVIVFSHGFVVLQPTHPDSRTLALPPEDPRTPHIWRSRIEDMRRVLDHLGRHDG